MNIHPRKYSGLLWLVIAILPPTIIHTITPHSPSIWGDEVYGGLTFLHSKSYSDFFLKLWSIGPEVAPIYPSILYLTYKVLGFQETILRLLSLLFYILNILVAYFILSSLTNRSVGFIGTLILSIFPLNLWYSLILRPHILSFLFASISILITIKKLKEDHLKILEPLLLIVNILLVLTHYAYFWLPIVESLLSSKEKLKKKKYYFKYDFANLFIALSLFSYITLFVKTNNVNFQSNKSLFELLTITFGLLDREIPFINSWSIFIQPIFFYGKHMPSYLTKILDFAPYIITYGGNFIFIIIVVSILVSYLRSVFTKGTKYPTPLLSFLISIGVLFPLFLSTLEIISGMSVAMPRYLYPSFLCKIILILMIIYYKVPKTHFKVVFFSLILLYFSHNYILYTFTSPYTEWKKCLTKIESEALPEDILLTGRYEEALVIHWNKISLQLSENLKTFYSSSLISTIKGINWLRSKYPNSNVWVIYSNQWNPDIPCILTEEFSKHHIDHQITVYPGFEGISCVKIPPLKEVPSQTPSIETYRCTEDFNWEEVKLSILNSITNLLKNGGDLEIDLLERNHQLLEELIFPEGTAGFNTFPTITYSLCKNGAYDLAESLCKKFSDQLPLATLSWGIVKIEENKVKDAEKVLRKLRRQNIYLSLITKPLLKAYMEDDLEELLAQAKNLKAEYYPLGWIFEEIVKDKLTKGNNEFFTIGIFPFYPP